MFAWIRWKWFYNRLVLLRKKHCISYSHMNKLIKSVLDIISWNRAIINEQKNLIQKSQYANWKWFLPSFFFFFFLGLLLQLWHAQDCPIKLNSKLIIKEHKFKMETKAPMSDVIDRQALWTKLLFHSNSNFVLFPYHRRRRDFRKHLQASINSSMGCKTIY